MEIAHILVSATAGQCLRRKRIPAGLAGGTVTVEFTDPIWDRLQKTVVFRGSESRIAEFDGAVAVIPWEVIQQPELRLYFGIWGSDPDTGLQLPLIEVPIGVTETATDPNADPGTDSTLPIWAQLQQDVEELKQGGTGGTGKPGADGFSPIATVVQTETGAVISITDKNGTTKATITNGKEGPQGPAYTLTEADKQAITADVIAALPVYNGEVTEV